MLTGAPSSKEGQGQTAPVPFDGQFVDPVPEVSALLDPNVSHISGTTMLAATIDHVATAEKKIKAYEMFLSTDTPIDAIALSTQLPVFVLQHWVASEQWGERKAQFALQLYKKVELDHQKFILDNRLETAQRHLATAKLLEEEVKWMLEQMAAERSADSPTESTTADGETASRPGRGRPRSARGSDMSLVRLSQALKNATDISARAVAIHEMQLSGMNQQNQQPQTVIVLGAKPAPMRTASDVSSRRVP